MKLHIGSEVNLLSSYLPVRSWSPDFLRLLLSNCLNWKINCDDHSSLSSTDRSSYMNYMDVWLHSSVGRASHRYRGGHGFESRWSPDFSGFDLLSNCLNWKINCDDHSSLSSTTAVHIWIISYKLHINIMSVQFKDFDIILLYQRKEFSLSSGATSIVLLIVNIYKN